MRTSLTLRRETLAALTTDELAGVAGGDATGGCPYTMRLPQCLSLYEYCGTGPETTHC